MTFQDDFDRTDRDLNGDAGWAVLDDDDNGTAAIQIVDSYATPADGTDESAAWQTGTVPQTTSQVVEGWITSTVEHANASVELFLGGNVQSTWADSIMSIRAGLWWLPNGQRDLRVTVQFEGQAAPSHSSAITLIGTDGRPTQGFEAALLADGALGVVQSLRMIATPAEPGVRVRVYVNQTDDDHPTHEVLLQSDWIVPGSGQPEALAHGYPGFRFGACGTNGALAATYFLADDYELDDRVELEVQPNQVTLAELRQNVRMRIAGLGTYNVADHEIDAMLRDSVRTIFNVLGDSSTFRIRVETMTLTPDTHGYVTLAPHVRRVHDIQRSDTAVPIYWSFDALDTSGNVVIRLHNREAGSYRVTYLPHLVEMSHDTDACPLPREHSEVVVMGACERLAERDNNTAQQVSFQARFQGLMQLLQRDIGRDLSTAREVLRPVRMGPRRGPWIR